MPRLGSGSHCAPRVRWRRYADEHAMAAAGDQILRSIVRHPLQGPLGTAGVRDCCGLPVSRASITETVLMAGYADYTGALFDPAPVPQRLCAALAARFGSMDLPQLQRIIAEQSSAAVRLANEA